MLARIYAEKSRQKRLVEKKGTEHANATLQSENAQLKRQLAALTRSPGIEIELNGSLFLCYQIGKVPAVPATGAAGARSSMTPPPGSPPPSRSLLRPQWRPHEQSDPDLDGNDNEIDTEQADTDGVAAAEAHVAVRESGAERSHALTHRERQGLDSDSDGDGEPQIKKSKLQSRAQAAHDSPMSNQPRPRQQWQPQRAPEPLLVGQRRSIPMAQPAVQQQQPPPQSNLRMITLEQYGKL